MNPNLKIYFRDHLAAATFAIELLERLSRKHEGDALAARLTSLLQEIQADRAALERLAKTVGVAPSGFKQTLARITEKLSRPKLIKSKNDQFSSFQAIETIALGIVGKKGLWSALAVADQSGFGEFDFDRYKRRAVEQYDNAEKLRLELAAASLRSHPSILER